MSFNIYAYLISADSSSEVAAQSLLKQLRAAFDRRHLFPEDVTFLVAIDRASYILESDTERKPILEFHQVGVSPVVEVSSPGETYEQRLHQFVKWINKFHVSEHDRSVFMLSGHGIPGLGVSGDVISWMKANSDSRVLSTGEFLEGERIGMGRNRRTSIRNTVKAFGDTPLWSMLGHNPLARSDNELKDSLLGVRKMLRHLQAIDEEGTCFLVSNPESNDFLTPPQLRSALAYLGKQLDCVYLHSCSMGNVETMYELQTVTHSVVAYASRLSGRGVTVEPDSDHPVVRWFGDMNGTLFRLKSDSVGLYLAMRDAWTAHIAVQGEPTHLICTGGVSGSVAWDAYCIDLCAAVDLMLDLKDYSETTGKYVKLVDSVKSKYADFVGSYKSSSIVSVHDFMGALSGASGEFSTQLFPSGALNLLSGNAAAIVKYQYSTISSGTTSGPHICLPRSRRALEMYRKVGFEFLKAVRWDRVVEWLGTD